MNHFLASIGIGVPISLLTMVVSVPSTLAQINPASSDYEHYYIGLDGREFLTSGTYAGLVNPNYNRLTFLFPHLEPDPSTNHFHGIGSYSYTGVVENPTIIPTSTNNRLPEYWTGLPPISLVRGTGVFANYLISQPTVEEYTNWQIKPVRSLLDYGSEPATQFLYNSSGGRWQGSLNEAQIALELVSITPGLGIANAQGVDLFAGVGDRYEIGQGDNFSFTPIFYTAKSAPVGHYWAELRLVDLNDTNGRTPWGASGTFIVDFQVQSVPEASTLLGLGFFSTLALGNIATRRQEVKDGFGKKV
jgi:hypothetical protein